MHERCKITDHDRERLDSELNQIFLSALKVELRDLDQTTGQLKALRAAVDAMAGHVQALRGKWYPGCDDGGPAVEYRPQRETRQQEVRQ